MVYSTMKKVLGTTILREILTFQWSFNGNIPPPQNDGRVPRQKFPQDVEEFLYGCMRLRGEAKALDLAKLMHSHAWFSGGTGNPW